MWEARIAIWRDHKHEAAFPQAIFLSSCNMIALQGCMPTKFATRHNVHLATGEKAGGQTIINFSDNQEKIPQLI
jgi:hypothetical protein